MPTTLMIGTADTTVIGSNIVSPQVKEQLGYYNVLGKQVAQMIPGARLIEFPRMGHASQMEEPQKFHQALLEDLARLNSTVAR